MNERTIRAFLSLMMVMILCSDGQTTWDRLCPPEEEIYPCECRSRGMEALISCRNSNSAELRLIFSVISRRLPLVNELILEQNYIPELFGNFFGSLRMRKLLLWGNDIDAVVDDAFSGLEFDLEEIFIRENKLMYLSEKAFTSATGLKLISIENTPVDVLPNTVSLKKAEIFKLETSLLNKLDEGAFGSSTNLKELTITYSDISIIPPLSNSKMWRLFYLNISHNEIEIVTSRALEQFPNLEILDMSHNNIRELSMFSESLKEAKLLRHVFLDGNKLDELQTNSFQNFPSLSKLSLRDCGVSTIDQHAFVDLPILESVDLGGNLLQFLVTGILKNVPKLQSVNLEKNLLSDWMLAIRLLNEHPQVEEINLGKNQFRRINITDFTMIRSRLRRLSLADNHISVIDPLALSFHLLEELNLSGNELESPNLRVTWPATLRVLDLSRNKITMLRVQNFERLATLKVLNISDTSLFAIEEGAFRVFKGLQSLDMSRNFLENIASDQLQGLEKLEHLDLSSNQLRNLEKTVFRELFSLQTLNLSSNKLKTIEAQQLPRTATLLNLNLAENDIETLDYRIAGSLRNLERMNLQGNKITVVDERTFQGLERLRTLDLSENQIAKFSSRTFSDLTALIELDLSSNQLEGLSSDYFPRLGSLMKLNLSRNAFSYFDGAVLRNLLSLRNLDISRNRMSEVPSFSLNSLRSLDMSHNVLENLQSFKIENFPSLTELDLSNNSIEFFGLDSFKNSKNLFRADLSSNKITEIPQNAFSGLPSLRELRLNNNSIEVIRESAFIDIRSMESLELQQNRLYRIDSGAFTEPISISKLDLSRNGLNTIIRSGIEKLSSLEVLDLSGNNLIEVDDKVFKRMERLTELKLKGNAICHVSPKAFLGQSRLSSIDFRDNQIRVLANSTFNGATGSLLDVKLSGNPLSCTCQIEWLARNLRSTDVMQSRYTKVDSPKNERRKRLGWLVKEDGTRIYRSPRTVDEPEQDKPICNYPPELVGNDIRSLPIDQLPCRRGRQLQESELNACAVPYEEKSSSAAAEPVSSNSRIPDSATTVTDLHRVLAELTPTPPTDLPETPDPFLQLPVVSDEWSANQKQTVKKGSTFFGLPINWTSLGLTLLPPLIAGTKFTKDVIEERYTQRHRTPSFPRDRDTLLSVLGRLTAKPAVLPRDPDTSHVVNHHLEDFPSYDYEREEFTTFQPVYIPIRLVPTSNDKPEAHSATNQENQPTVDQDQVGTALTAIEERFHDGPATALLIEDPPEILPVNAFQAAGKPNTVQLHHSQLSPDQRVIKKNDTPESSVHDSTTIKAPEVGTSNENGSPPLRLDYNPFEKTADGSKSDPAVGSLDYSPVSSMFELSKTDGSTFNTRKPNAVFPGKPKRRRPIRKIRYKNGTIITIRPDFDWKILKSSEVDMTESAESGEDTSRLGGTFPMPPFPIKKNDSFVSLSEIETLKHVSEEKDNGTTVDSLSRELDSVTTIVQNETLLTTTYLHPESSTVKSHGSTRKGLDVIESMSHQFDPPVASKTYTDHGSVPSLLAEAPQHSRNTSSTLSDILVTLGEIFRRNSPAPSLSTDKPVWESRGRSLHSFPTVVPPLTTPSSVAPPNVVTSPARLNWKDIDEFRSRAITRPSTVIYIKTGGVTARVEQDIRPGSWSLVEREHPERAESGRSAAVSRLFSVINMFLVSFFVRIL